MISSVMICTQSTFVLLLFFFFNDPATTEIYTLSLHDALPIYPRYFPAQGHVSIRVDGVRRRRQDRKSTRLNSSHSSISYAVFCLKKKKSNRGAHAHRHDVP